MSFQRDPVRPPTYPPPQPPRRGMGWSPGRFLPAILLVSVVVVGLLVGAVALTRRNSGTDATPTTSLAGQPVAGPSSAASAPPSAAQVPSASAVPSAAAASARASAAPRVFLVGNTDGDGVYLRRTPSMADRDTAYADGTKLIAIGDDVTAEGELWHHVSTPDGKQGYVPARYTVDPPR